MFNTVKNKRKETVSHVRHLKLKEPPLPVYLGMLIHNKTRKKGLVNEFAEQGLSISYSRLQEIQNNIAGQLCHQYVTEGVVRPTSLKDGLFTSAAIDNIDSNPSSTTANSAFHGTSISIFQHPKEDYPDEPFILDINSDFEHEKATLPSFYTNIEPTKDGKPRPPATHTTAMSTGDRKVIEEAEKWLSKLIYPEIPLSEKISFSGFYSEKEISTQHKWINELLPLLVDSVNSLGMA